MLAPEPPLVGDELLVAVTDAMVVLHDLLACVLGGVYTDE
jgi:hypothetical protein